jgi:hypothetical protein
VESDIQGSSMGATIPDGSRIRIRARGEESFRPGQIVACLENGFLFAHRVVHVRKDAIITQGDGWILCDPPLRTSQVVGEVISRRVGDAWVAPAAEAGRPAAAERAARRQVRLIALCLRIDLAFARFVSRRIIRAYIFGKHCRGRLALPGRRREGGRPL